MAKSDQQRWKEQAAFMREVGAVHAEWWIPADSDELQLMKLVLGPTGPTIPITISRTTPAQQPAKPKVEGPAARALRFHETMFAASSMKPPPPQATAPAAVPRPRQAKKAAKRGSTKNQKRGS